MTAGLPSIQKAVSDYFAHALPNISEAGKQTQGVISQIISNFDSIRVLAKAEEDDPKAEGFSVRGWLSNAKSGQIILGGSTEHERLSASVMRAVITSFSAQLMARKDSKTRRVWLVCDEFPKLGKCEAVPKLLAFGRSKGARVVLLAQDLSQLQKTYGADDKKSMTSMIGTIIVGRTAGGETADLIAKTTIGTRVVERKNITFQGNGASSSSFSRDEILVVHPSELQTELGKRGNQIQALVIGLGEYVLNLPFVFVCPPPFRSPFVWRECFLGVENVKTLPTFTKDEILALAKVNQKETEQEDGKHATKEAVSHQIGEAVPTPLGGFLEALAIWELAFKNAGPQASPIHKSQTLKIDKEEEIEKE